MRLIPQDKAGRLALQQATIDRKLKEGFSLEDYKGYKILTKDHEAGGKIRYSLEVFRPAAGQPYLYEWHRTPESRSGAIKSAKETADYKESRRQQRKTIPHNPKKAAIIAALQKAGYNQRQVSVCDEGGSTHYSFYLTIRDASVNFATVEAIAEDNADISRDEATGEILSGGNTYTWVRVSDEVKKTWTAKYLPKVQAALRELDKLKEEGKLNYGVPIDEQFSIYWSSNGYHLQVSHKGNWLPMDYSRQGEGEEIAFRLYKLTQDEPEPAAVEPEPPLLVVTGRIEIIDYSERAFAVIGDTKPIREKLAELNGKFNAHLKCGPGWIFSKKRLTEVTEALTPKRKLLTA